MLLLLLLLSIGPVWREGCGGEFVRQRSTEVQPVFLLPGSLLGSRVCGWRELIPTVDSFFPPPSSPAAGGGVAGGQGQVNSPLQVGVCFKEPLFPLKHTPAEQPPSFP